MPRPTTARPPLLAGAADEVFVGRDAVCEQLDRLLLEAPTGGGARVVLGEAGIGRSALLRRAVRRSLVPVHWVQGTRTESDVPFAAAADLLWPFMGHVDALPLPQRRALRIALAVAPGHAPEPLATCRGALAALTAAARTAPFVVAVDDLQWIDDASRRLMTYVARRVTGQHLVMLLASREDAWTDPVDHGLPVVRLTGLTERDCENLARLTGVTVSPRQLGLLVQSSGGNPRAFRESLMRLRTGTRVLPGLDGLTTSEAQVARLIATGLSNREIAVALYVSRKTVEAHLTRIYRKLRIRSRADLTRIVVVDVTGRFALSEHSGESQEVGDRAHR